MDKYKMGNFVEFNITCPPSGTSGEYIDAHCRCIHCGDALILTRKYDKNGIPIPGEYKCINCDKTELMGM